MYEDKARELGRLIGQGGEFQALQRAEDALRQDATALDLLRMVQELREKAGTLIESGQQPPEEMEKELEALLNQVQSNPSYQRLMIAQQKLDELMQKVNQLISEGIQLGAKSSIILT